MLSTIAKRLYTLNHTMHYNFAFSEQTFMQAYLQSFLNNQRNQQELLNTLEVDKINNLQTIIGIVDKTYKNNIILRPQLKEDLLKRTQDLLKEQRQVDTPYMKGLILVLALNKLDNKALFVALQQYLDRYHDQLEMDHLITILETLVFNKLFVKFFVRYIRYEYDISPLLNRLNEFTEQSEVLFDGEVVRKSLAILIYFQKNEFTQFESINKQLIQSMQIAFKIFLNQFNKQPSTMAGLYRTKNNTPFGIQVFYIQYKASDAFFTNIFKIVEVQDQFEQLALVNQNQKQKYKDFFNLYQSLSREVQLILDKHLKEDKLQSLVFSREKIDIIINYLKKYLSAPPLYLPKSIHNIIGNVYISIIHDFMHASKSEYTMNEILPFLIFLVKTRSQLKLDKDQITLFNHFIHSEKSIFNLQRLIECISILYSAESHVPVDLLHKCVAQIEERIITLSKQQVKPTQPLLQLFQSIVMLHPYKPTNMRYLLEYFHFGQVLEKLTWVELLVKFIPSLGILTKNLSNQFYISEKMELQKELQDLWEKLTLLLNQRISHINIDKIPSLLVYMSHSNFFVSCTIPKFLINLKKIILNNLPTYNGLQLCEIVFSYARMNYNEVTFYRHIAKHIEYNKIALNFQSATGIMWALSVQKVKIDHFLMHLETSINQEFTKGTEELIIQYFQANTILNRQPPEKIVQEFYKQIRQSYGQKEVSFKNYLQLMIGLLQNQQDQQIWQDLEQCLLEHKDQIKKQPVLCHQLFLLYFRYHLSNPDLGALKRLKFILDPSILRDYCVNFKRVKSSDMELNVVEVLKQMQNDGLIITTDNNKSCIFVDDIIENPNLQFSLHDFIPYQCDLRIGDLCFEINGPRHYLRKFNQNYEQEEEELDGPTRLKRQSLESRGFKYVEVSYHLYEDYKDQDLIEQLKLLII